MEPAKTKPSTPKSVTKLIDNIASLNIREPVIQISYVVQNAQTSPFTSHLNSCRGWMFVDDMNTLQFESGQHIVVKSNEKMTICVAWPSDNVQSGGNKEIFRMITKISIYLESKDRILTFIWNQSLKYRN